MEKLIRKMSFVHPGVYLKNEIIEANNLTISEAAELLDVSRTTISNIVNLKSGITAEMALRITDVFGGTPNFWLKSQAEYDLQQQKKSYKFKLKKFKNAAL